MTIGASDALISGAKTRADKLADSPYDFINYALLGTPEMFKEAVMPEDPFSKEHLENSFGLASFAVPVGVKVVGSKGSVGTVGDKQTVKSQESIESPGVDAGKGTGKDEILQSGRYAERLDYLHDKYGKLSSEQINQRINLRGETMNELESLKQIYDGKPNFGKDKMGPALAGVLDKSTGQYHYAINTFDGAVPELVPLLKNRLDDMPTEVFESYSQLSKGAGSHAEVLAVNNALKKNPNARIEDLNINVIRTGVNKNKPGGLMFKCCPHCTYLLEGFEIISEVPKVGR